MIKVGAILAGLLLLSTAQSMYVFLGKEKLGLVKWFFFNACAPLNIFFLIGFLIFFLFKRSILIYAAALPILFFALWGLVSFSWENPLSQLGHLIMFLNVLWVVLLVLQTRDYKTALVGFLLGLLLLLIFFGLQQNFVREHWEEFRQVMPVRK
jgi:hypothetical protein